MMARLNAWWQQRQPRERQTLAIGAGALAALLVLGLGILPLLDRHQALAQRLPRLREAAAQLDAQAATAEALRARVGPAAPAAPPALPELQRSLDAAGLRAPGDALSTQAGGQIEIRLASANFDSFMRWLAATRRSAGLAATLLEADALDTPGQVRIHCLLAGAGGR